MDWIFWGCIVFLFVLVGIIFVVLFTIVKKGDERSNYIKQKAMANALRVMIGILILNIIERIVVVLNEGKYQEPGSIFLLLSLSIVYLASLLWMWKKHGR